MPESLKYEPPQNTPEKKEQVDKKIKKETSPKQKEFQRGRERLNALENSEISNDLKEIMSGWLEQNLQGESLQAYVDTVRENPDAITIAHLVEGISEVLLGQNPDMMDKLEQGEISLANVADGVFDVVFQSAQRNLPAERFQNLLNNFREITSQ